MTDDRKDEEYFRQINIWEAVVGNEELTLVETIVLDVEDGRYGDDGEALYLTGLDSKGRFVEVVVAVPERVAALGSNVEGV